MNVQDVAVVARRSGLRRAFLGSVALLLCAVFVAVNLVGVHLVGTYAWDDGAITLAYARTLAEHGVFALTSQSEVVEGTSSLLLTGLMALLHATASPNFDEFIRAAQLIAFACVCAIAVLVYGNLRSAVPDPVVRAVITLILVSLPMFTTEVFNGMEMSLFALLLASLTLAFDARSRLIFLLIPLVLLCRFESIFYLALAFSMFWYIEPKERHRLTSLFAYLIAVFVVLTLSRWLYFGDILPNTVWAKLNPPYSKGKSLWLILVRKLQGAEEFVSVNSFLLLASGSLLCFRETWRKRLDLKVLLVVAIGVFAVITGPVAGYPGRMSLACLPLLVLITRDTLIQAGSRGQTLVLNRGHDLEIRANGQLTVSILVLALLGTHFANRALFEENAFTAAIGAHYQSYLPEDLDTLVKGRIESAKQPLPWYGISPANFRLTGLTVDAIRSSLNLPTIKVLTPDVGGLGLCCDHLNVLDSGLLTNRFLARQGWAGFDRYLQRTVPDVVTTYEPWSRLSGIYTSRYFAMHYEPIVFENNLFWLNRRHLLRLLEAPQLASVKITDLRVLDRVRYATDREHFAERPLDFMWQVHRK